MSIIFKKIILDSFLSYDHEEIDINQTGIVFIRGENMQETKSESNGSGKSALIAESLLWCLTGTTSRNASVVNNLYLDRGASVTVELKKDNSEYIITRGTHNSRAANGLTIYKDGENVTKARIADSKEWLEKEFPELSWTVLTSIVILTQGLVGGFSTMPNRDRKAKLEELSQVNVVYNAIAHLTDATKVRKEMALNDIRKDMAQVRATINANDFLINSLTETITKIKEKNASLSAVDELQKQIEVLEIKVQDYANEYAIQSELLRTKTTDLDTATQKHSELSLLYSTYSKEWDEYLLNKKNAESTIVMLNAQNKHDQAHLDAVHDDECPTCHQPVGIEVTQKYRQELLDKIDARSQQILEHTKKAELTDRLAGLSKLITVTESDLTKVRETVSECRAAVAKLQTALYSISKNKSDCELEIKRLLAVKSSPIETTYEYERQISELRSTNDASNIKLAEYIRNETHAVGEYEIAAWFASQTSKALRAYLLEGVIDFINMKCEEYSAYLFDTEIVRLKTDGSSLDIYLGEKQIENVSGGEHRRVDIIMQLAIRDLVMNESGFNSNLLVIDEVFDHLDSIGISAVLDLVTSQKSSITSIFLITHKSDADIEYDSTLTIRKENNISRVVT